MTISIYLMFDWMSAYTVSQSLSLSLSLSLSVFLVSACVFVSLSVRGEVFSLHLDPGVIFSPWITFIACTSTFVCFPTLFYFRMLVFGNEFGGGGELHLLLFSSSLILFILIILIIYYIIKYPFPRYGFIFLHAIVIN